MKKLFLLLFATTVIGVCYPQGNWVSFTSTSPQSPEVNLVTSNSSVVQFDVEIYGMYSEDVDNQGVTYQRLSIPEAGRTDIAGDPEIPYVRQLIAIPECQDVSLSINVTGQTTLSNYNVYPAPRMVEVQNGDYIYLDEEFYINPASYALNNNYPTVQAEIKSTGYLRDQKYAEVYVYPVQYNPSSQVISVNYSYNLSLSFTNATTDVNVNTGIFNNVASNTFLNYTSSGITAEINDQASNPGSVQWINFTDVSQASNIIADYLIITDDVFYDPQDPNSALYEIAQHRAEYNGFDVAIVKVEQILTSGFFDPNITPYKYETAIRKFVKAVYEGGNALHTYDGKLAYVLLVGDAIYDTDFGVPTSKQTFLPYPAEIINDYYYTCITDDQGVPDYFGDLYIGRLCVRTEDKLNNFVSKIIEFESEADFGEWRNKVYFANTEGIDVHNIYANLLEKYEAMENQYIPNPYETVIFDEYDVPPSEARQKFIENINNGCLFMSFYGHSMATYYGIGSNQYTVDIDYMKQNLSNESKYPFALNYTCLTGKYADDLYGDYCIGEVMTSYSDNAGFVGILAAVDPVNIAMNDMEYPPDRMNNGYMEYSIFNKFSHIAGEFILDTRLAEWGAWTFNYFGDPALNIMAQGFEITNNMTIPDGVTISTDVYIRPGVTCYIGAGRDLYFGSNGRLIVEEGATLSIAGGSTVHGIDPYNEILVYGDLIVYGNVRFTAPENSTWKGIVYANHEKDYSLPYSNHFERCGISGYAHSLNVSNATFNNSSINFSIGGLTVESCQFTDSYVETTNGELVMPVEIANCYFNNQNISDYPITIDDYTLFEIYGNEIMHNDKTGIAIYNSKSVRQAFVNDIYDNNIYSETSGSGTADFGIRIYNSHADIINNNYIHDNYVGVICYNSSEVSLMGDCNAENEALAQRIKNNSQRQVFTDGSSFPTHFKYNVIYDDNASTYYVYFDRKYLSGTPDTDISENNWGTGFIPANNLYPASQFIYTPYWNFGCSKNGSVQTRYDSAIVCINNGEFNKAEDLFREIILQNPTSKYAKASVKELFALKEVYDQDYAGLKIFYDTTNILQDTSDIANLAYWLSNKCDVEMGNYQQAVNWYENIISNPESELDSVFAIIDLGYVYQLMGDNNQRQAVNCKFPMYNINSKRKYMAYRNELLDMLWKEESIAGFEDQKLLQDNYFNIYPNPTSAQVSVEFTIETNTEVVVELYDNTGRLIQKSGKRNYAKGKNTIMMDCSDLPVGVYLCKLIADNQYVTTKKLIKE